MTATPLSRRCSGRDLCLSFCSLLSGCPAWSHPQQVWSRREHACTLSICVLCCELCKSWMNLMDGLDWIALMILKVQRKEKTISKSCTKCTCLNVSFWQKIIGLIASWRSVGKALLQTLFESRNRSGLGSKGGIPLVNSILPLFFSDFPEKLSK